MWLALLLSCGTRTGSILAFTVDDDVEIFEDLPHDGIVVSCSGDRESVSVTMERTLFDEAEGPTFHATVTLDSARGPAPDEGATYERDQLGRVSVGYHGDTWPTDDGSVVVTDFVAVDDVNRVSVTLSGFGDGGDISLDGTITCVR